MKRLLISGINGRMGRSVSEYARNENFNVVCGVDKKIIGNVDCPVYKNFSEVRDYVDVIIDFSSAENLDDLLTFATQTNTPAAICVTGFNDEQLKKINAASETLPIYLSPNTSQGVNLLKKICKTISSSLGDFEAEIIETHHKNKADAPSGTAKLLYEEIANQKNFPVYGRTGKRKENEIGLHSVRGGNAFGEHECKFFFGNECISVKHTAFSSSVFAIGALKAARYILGKTPGLYNSYDY
ncbi:MAG: 4-hydroxy-tetrahydrodipicolinate reductase [Clostridia bacterium]|nr:4-hydroxy-tetrahydrodipicolinate reductase [Clostridia bacterium]